jgi:hypothetical protein
MDFQSPSRHVNIVHNHFLARSFQFIIHNDPVIRCCLIYSFGETVILDISHLPIRTYLIEGDALLPLLFGSASGHCIRKVPKTRFGCCSVLMKLICWMTTYTVKKHTEALTDVS